VKSASVTVDGELIASIGKGVLALAAVGKDDTIKDSERSASKLLHMKLWDDENGGRVRTWFVFAQLARDYGSSGNSLYRSFPRQLSLRPRSLQYFFLMDKMSY
jgi:D-tyrosyl-tRNA(Tyr) deacylase